jgi:hypothetical protein
MKKTLVAFAVALVLIPSFSYATTHADLEKQRIQLLEQVIVLLKARLGELLALKEAGQLPTVGTSTLTSANEATSTPIIKKKRSGGGSSNRRDAEVEPIVIIAPEPLVLDMAGEENIFSVHANKPLDPTFIAITGRSIGMDPGAFISEIPNSLTIRAKTSTDVLFDIALLPDLPNLRYTGNMQGLLPEGVTFTGEFEIVVPEFFQDAEIAYTIYLETNGESREIDVTYNETDEVAELLVSVSAEDPDATTIVLDEDDNTEAVIFAFDLSSEEGEEGIDLNSITINVIVDANGIISVDDLVNDFRLEIGGDSFDAESYTGTGTTTEITFDIDGDVDLDPREQVTATLYAEFENSQDPALEGSRITASVDPQHISADSWNDVVIHGPIITGETHTLRTESLVVELIDESVVMRENDETTSTDNTGVFTLEFAVTPFGDDIYLPFGASRTTDLTAGVEFSIINTNTNAVVTTGQTIVSLDTEDFALSNSFEINEGDSQNFILVVSYDPVVSGTYKLRLDDINFANTDAAIATDTQDVSDEDIDTAQVTIVG